MQQPGQRSGMALARQVPAGPRDLGRGGAEGHRHQNAQCEEETSWHLSVKKAVVCCLARKGAKWVVLQGEGER